MAANTTTISLLQKGPAIQHVHIMSLLPHMSSSGRVVSMLIFVVNSVMGFGSLFLAYSFSKNTV